MFPHNGILLSNKKEQTVDTYTMDEFQKRNSMLSARRQIQKAAYL